MKELIINLFLASLLSTLLASDKSSFNAERMNNVPRIVLWAWERPEDLRFIDPTETAVCYYAGIIHLRGDWASFHPRMNPLRVPSGTIMYPVFRIQESENSGKEPEAPAIERACDIICDYAAKHDSSVVQIDYDAMQNSRKAYLLLLKKIRNRIPEHTALSVTALASWCLDDRWLGDAPVDESVAMLFTMGPATEEVLSLLPKHSLQAGTPIQSVGASSYELKTNQALKSLRCAQNYRRLYLFNRNPWTRETYLNCKGDLL